MKNENKNNFLSYVPFMKVLLLPRIIEPLIPATQPTGYDTKWTVVSYYSNRQMARKTLTGHVTLSTKRMGALSAVINDDSGRFLKIFWGVEGVVHIYNAVHDKIIVVHDLKLPPPCRYCLPLQGRSTASVGNWLPTIRDKANNWQQTLRNDPE
jgi:hypothetical protein